VSDISRPEEYEKALRSKERAREDIMVSTVFRLDNYDFCFVLNRNARWYGGQKAMVR
jgi:hypothetical protein